MNFLYYVTDDVDYEFIYIIILIGHVMNIFLIIAKINYGAIDTDDTSCQGFYIITFPLSPYTLQEDLNIDVKFIYSGKMVCKRIYLSQ